MKTWGAVFDWDGVIIDSSTFHEKSWEVLAAEENRILPPDHFKRGFGMKNAAIIPNVLGWAKESDEVQRIALKKETIYQNLIRKHGIAPMPGVIEWLEVLRSAEIPCSIASSTDRANIDVVLERTDLKKYFTEIVSGDQAKLGKPHPEIFLLASARLKISPKCCIVFEDAHVGIEAAKAANMKVVAVTTTHPAFSLQDADMVVDRLDELSLDAITKLLHS